MTSPQALVGSWHRATFDPCPLPWVGLKLAAEAGELCQAVLTADGEPRRDGRAYEEIREEAADVLIVLYAIADRAGFDLGVAFWERFEEVSRRQYPGVEVLS
jgi:NTP pyrophosphatase (non-canonical NTP hydrolase)